MIPPFTEAQEALLAALRMSNTDHRAMQMVEAAFAVRNAYAPRGVGNVNEALQELARVTDEVAG